MSQDAVMGDGGGAPPPENPNANPDQFGNADTAGTAHNASVKFTRPANVAEHEYVQMESINDNGEKYKYYVLDTRSPEFNTTFIIETGSLRVDYETVPFLGDAALLGIRAVVESIVRSYRSAKGMLWHSQKDHHATNEKVSRDTHDRRDITARHMKTPREWNGAGKPSVLATDLPVWLLEVQDYMDLANIPVDKQAGLATSFVTGSARVAYMTRRSHAMSIDQHFKHDMKFFEKTLRDIYIPVTQKCSLLKDFHLGAWKLPFGPEWTVSAQLDSIIRAVRGLESEHIRIDPLWSITSFLTSLPSVQYDMLKLDSANEYRTDWKALTDEVYTKQEQLMDAYRRALAAGIGCDPPAISDVRTSVPKRHAPKHEIGHGMTKRTAVASAVTASPAARPAASGGGPSKGGEGGSSTQVRGCPICYMPSHQPDTCPFLNTTANNRRQGFAPSVQTAVRGNAALYVGTDGKTNKAFKDIGGAISTVEVTPPTKPKFKRR